MWRVFVQNGPCALCCVPQFVERWLSTFKVSAKLGQPVKKHVRHGEPRLTIEKHGGRHLAADWPGMHEGVGQTQIAISSRGRSHPRSHQKQVPELRYHRRRYGGPHWLVPQYLAVSPMGCGPSRWRGESMDIATASLRAPPRPPSSPGCVGSVRGTPVKCVHEVRRKGPPGTVRARAALRRGVM